jgi:DNA-binding NarL/FixJ family response regulator
MSRSKDTLLLIEDSEDYRDYLRLLLAPHFELDDAPTLAHGLAKLRERSYFAVLLDLSLPESNLRANFPAVAKSITPASIVIIDPREDPFFVAQMIRWGAAGYVVKGKDDQSAAHLHTMICNAVRHDRIQIGLDGTTRLAKEIETELRAR